MFQNQQNSAPSDGDFKWTAPMILAVALGTAAVLILILVHDYFILLKVPISHGKTTFSIVLALCFVQIMPTFSKLIIMKIIDFKFCRKKKQGLLYRHFYQQKQNRLVGGTLPRRFLL